MESKSVSGDLLKQFIEKILKLEQEKEEVAELLRETFTEAKSLGLDVSVLRKVVRMVKMDPDKRTQELLILEAYLAALGLSVS